jgi:hypothetical protein
MWGERDRPRGKSVSKIAEWLASLGMAEYTERFAENGIEIDVLSELTDQDLEKLGVLLGHRRRILKAIRELGQPPPAAPRVAAATPKATDAEAAQLYRTMLAYAGRYTLEGDKITDHVDISWNQLNIDLQRFVEVKNNQLTIKTPPFMSPFLNKQIVATVVLERAK